MTALPVSSKTSPCNLCPLGERAITDCIPARRGGSHEILNRPVKYLLVGDAPGPYEDKRGIPFTGKAGKLLDKALGVLAEEGLDLDEVGITHAVRCFPQFTPKGKVKAPTKKIKDTCRYYLDLELEVTAPDVIVCLGSGAFSSLCPEVKGGVGANRLKSFLYGGIPVVVTFHPKACNFDPNLRVDFITDLESYLLRETWRAPAKDIPVTLVNSPLRVDKALSILGGAEEIGLDIETIGLNPKVLTIGVSFDRE